MEYIHTNAGRRISFNQGPSSDELAERIKERITIPILAEKLFPGWEPGKKCKSPFRDERDPSFSVFANDRAWNDFATGRGGDVFHFYQEATGCDRRQAFKDLLEMAGGKDIAVTPIARVSRPAEKKEQMHPPLRVPTLEELIAISRLRNISEDGLRLAVERGFLWTSTSTKYRQEAWIVTDQTRKCYHARRMDGKKWEHINSKSWTIPGGAKSWPIGIEEAQSFPAIALCEGEGDFLAAFDQASRAGVQNEVAPVCMAGASSKIPEEALPLFKNKQVRIFVHDDAAGVDAFLQWEEQLMPFALFVDGFDFYGLTDHQGSPITDLNDLARIDSVCLEQNKHIVNSIMQFAF